MISDIKTISSKKPKMLAEFCLAACTYESTGLNRKSDAFCLKHLYCNCGNEKLNVITSIKKIRKKGMFRSKHTIIPLAPIYIECPECKIKKLLFDPRIHGWDGENEDCASLTGEDGQIVFNDTPVAVYIELSYQGIENYIALIEEGITNPEDYFDTFSLYIFTQSSSQATEVVSYGCA